MTEAAEQLTGAERTKAEAAKPKEDRTSWNSRVEELEERVARLEATLYDAEDDDDVQEDPEASGQTGGSPEGASDFRTDPADPRD